MAAALLAGATAAAMEIPAAWTQPVDPVRIAGNIHYIGTEDLGAYLLVGDEGAILLDAPLEENAELLLKNIETVGIKVTDVHILLNSHAHMDHIGGMAAVKSATGGKLFLSAPDAELASRGGLNDFAFGDSLPYPPVDADAIIEDGQTIRLGDIAMTAVVTPGHTKGCTTWRTTVIENGKPLDVVFLCSITAPGYTLVGNDRYPEIGDDFRMTIEKLRNLQPDIFLANHGSFFDLTKKLSLPGDGGSNPFIKPGEFATYLERASKQLEAQAAKQRTAQ